MQDDGVYSPPRMEFAPTRLPPAWKAKYAAAVAQIQTDPEQWAVVQALAARHSTQPLVVIAGAGSGKTATLVVAVAYLVAEKIVPPDQIIFTTFTVKAREEIVARLKEIVDPVLFPELRAGTFHKLALNYLQSGDPDMPAHRWRNNRNIDGGDDEGREINKTAVVKLSDRIHRGISAQAAGPVEPNLKDHAYRVVQFLTEETNEATGRQVFVELFGTSKIAADLYRKLWGMLALPDSGTIWRKVLGDWPVPGLTNPNKMVWDAGLEREMPDSIRGLDVIRPQGKSAKDYSTQIEIMRGKGWSIDHPEAQALMLSLEDYGYRGIRAGWRLFNEVKEHFNAFDFADVLDAYWRRGLDSAQRVIVDEGQDNNYVQLDVSRKVGERGHGVLCLTGDIRQCIPGGQPIRVPGGFKPAREIRKGDAITTSYGGKTDTVEFVAEVMRTVHATAYEFETETGSTFQATGKHLLFSALGKPEGFYVYLMWRKGYGFRVGSSQATGDLGLKHVIVRTQQEQAERLWILKCVPNGQEARLLEHQIGYRFQVPMAPFKPRPDTMFASEEDAAAFFTEFKENGWKVLEAYGLDFDHPAYVAKSSARGRVAINVLLATGKGNSEVAVESQIVPEAVQAEFGFTPTKSECTRYRKYPKSAAAALRMARVLHAAMPEDSYVVQLLSVPESDRRVFAVHANGVHPGMLVPERDSDGIVRMRRVTRRVELPVSDCYDFEVTNAANFFVGNVVVHNSIYSFRGSAPEVMALAPQTIGARVLEITTNYRSGAEIVNLGNSIAAGKSWSMGGESRSGRSDVAGEVHLRGFKTAVDEAREVAKEIKQLLADGLPPKEVAVLTRTNAAGVIFEVGFLAAQVPVMVLGSSTSFFERTEIKDTLAFCILASRYGDRAFQLGALLRVWKTPIDREKPFNFMGEAAFKRNVEGDPTASGLRAAVRDPLKWVNRQKQPQRDWMSDAEVLAREIEKLSRLPWVEQVKAAGVLLTEPPYTQKDRLGGRKPGKTGVDSERGDRIGALVTIAAEFASLEALLAFTQRVANAALFFDNADGGGLSQKKLEAERGKRVVISTIHKCVAPETLIETSTGILRAGDLPQTGVVGTLDGPRSYTGRVDYTACPMLKITTEDGYSVSVTEDHGMSAWTGSEYARVAARDLEEGQYLRLALKPGVEVIEYPFLPSADGIPLDVRSARWQLRPQLTDTIAFLLGALVADGTVYTAGVRYTKTYRSACEAVAAAFVELGVSAVVEPHGGEAFVGWKVEVSSVHLAKWLILVGGLEPHKKAIPPVIWQAPLSAQRAFVRGVFSDGTVGVRKGRLDVVSLTSTSHAVAEGVHYLLRRAGIVARRFLVDAARPDWHMRVEMYAYGRKFLEEIGFPDSERTTKGLAAQVPLLKNYTVPVSKAEARMALTAPTRDHGRDRGYVSRRIFERDCPQLLERLGQHHDRILSIERVFGPAVCIEVPQGDRFLQNGFDGFNSKGLGWRRTYVSVTAGQFPSRRSKTEEERAEEERMFYVAATRAKEVVTFTYAEQGPNDTGGMSTFLEEYIEPLFEEPELPKVEGWALVGEDPIRYERADGRVLDVVEQDGRWLVGEKVFPHKKALVEWLKAHMEAHPLTEVELQAPPVGWTLLYSGLPQEPCVTYGDGRQTVQLEEVAAGDPGALADVGEDVEGDRNLQWKVVLNGRTHYTSPGVVPWGRMAPDALRAAHAAMTAQAPQEVSVIPTQATPVVDLSHMSPEDRAFCSYLRTLGGEAAPGTSWDALATALESDPELRIQVLARVRALVQGTVAGPPVLTEEPLDRILGPMEVTERTPVWVTLPIYPITSDRAGTGSLVADGRWVTIARPWKGIDPPALLLTDSVVVVDYPLGGALGGTEWRALRVGPGGRLDIVATVVSQPGDPKSKVADFYRLVDAEKRSGWASDILAAWLAERTVAPDVAKDARYVFEASVGQPIRTVGARVEIPDVDHTRQGKPTARFLADIDATGLKRLQAIGFLQQEGSGFRVVLPVPARPEAPKLGVGGPVPTEAPTSGPKARVVKRK